MERVKQHLRKQTSLDKSQFKGELKEQQKRRQFVKSVNEGVVCLLRVASPLTTILKWHLISH